MSDKNVLDFYMAETGKRLDRIETKIDTLMNNKSMNAGGYIVIAFIISTVVTLISAWIAR